MTTDHPVVRWRVRAREDMSQSLCSGVLLAQAEIETANGTRWFVRVYEDDLAGLPVEPSDPLPSMLEIVSSSLRALRRPDARAWSVRILRPTTAWRASTVKHVETFDDFGLAIDRAEELVDALQHGRRPWSRLGN